MPSTTFDWWDVALSVFPYVEKPRDKLRPILVLSSAEYNASHDVVVAAMITSATSERWTSDLDIEDLQSAGLDRRSRVRWKIFTLPTDVIERRLGCLSQTDRSSATQRLSAIFPARDADEKVRS